MYRRTESGIYWLTKLLGPNLRVTLSQVPPSKKETWGAEGKPSFPARPRANRTRHKKKQNHGMYEVCGVAGINMVVGYVRNLDEDD
jgi:hypothetical protein